MAQAPDHRPTTTRLPPPPAPVARDANPWTVSSRTGGTSRRGADRRRSATQPLPAPAPPRTGRGPARLVPIAIFLAVLGSIASGAFEALRRGDRTAALVPLVMLGIVAVGLWRSIRRSQHR